MLLLRFAGIVVFFLGLAYAIGALVFWHTPSPWLRVILIVFMIADVAFLWPANPPAWVSSVVPELWVRRALAASWIVVVLGLHLTRKPRDGNWIELQKKEATVAIDGSRATIQNYRFAKRELSEEGVGYQVDWEEKTIDVSQIVGVDLVIQRFGNWKGSAHAMCSFRLKDGGHVAVSVESRRELSRFNPVGGLYKYYQLIIIFGDERDLFWSRISSIQPYPMVIYPLDVTAEQAQQYFYNLAEEANQLAAQPEFYHVLEKNCLTVLVNASPQLKVNIVQDYRFCFPGFSHEIFSEIGLIKGDLEEVMKKYAVSKDTPQPSYEGDGKAWSEMIRAGGKN